MTYPEQLVPSNLENQTSVVPPSVSYNETTISEADFTSAKITIAIGYNQSDTLCVQVGVEKAVGPQDSGTSSDTSSISRLPTLKNRTTVTVANTAVIHPQIVKQVRCIYRRDSCYNITTFTINVSSVGFTKQDLVIATNRCHWFIAIQTQKSAESETSVSNQPCTGWLDSFNITIGDTRYASLLHPVFSSGWEVHAYITGRAGEVLTKPSQPTTGLRTKMSSRTKTTSHWHWENGTQVYGVAGIIGVAYFENENPRPGAKTSCSKILDFLVDTGIWEIYYMVTDDDTEPEYIDDEDKHWLLNLVIDAVLDSSQIDHCFWYLTSHAGMWPPGSMIGPFFCSSYSIFDGWMTETQLGEKMSNLTSEGIWLFVWLVCCNGDKFNLLWQRSDYHHGHALVWEYHPSCWSGTFLKDHEIPSLIDHVTYGQVSCQRMFPRSPQNTHTYPYYNGTYLSNNTVNMIEYAFEHTHSEDDMQAHDTMDGYEFCFVPNSQDWLPTCRSRNEPCIEFIQGSNDHEYDYAMHPYMVEAWEEDTFNCFVGFYKKVYVPTNAQGSNTLYIELQGRATSTTSASTVTNLRAYVYDATWEDRLTGHAFVNGGTTDTDWQDYSHTFENIPAGAYYNVLICYNDAWSAYRNQHIYAKNIYLGNVQEVTENIQNGGFEAGTLAPWETGYARVRSSSYYVQSGSYGCMQTYYDSQTWIYYQANIEQSLYVSVSDFEHLTFYMRSCSNTVRVTLYYNDDRSQSLDFGTSSTWVQRTIERTDLIAATTLIQIRFERLGTSSCTTTLDTIVLSPR